MRNPITWRERHNRPAPTKPYPSVKYDEPPRVRTPGLDALAAWLRKLRCALK